MIFIIHFISSLLFYPYNLYCIGCKVMFIVCDILIILFWLIFVDCKFFCLYTVINFLIEKKKLLLHYLSHLILMNQIIMTTYVKKMVKLVMNMNSFISYIESGMDKSSDNAEVSTYQKHARSYQNPVIKMKIQISLTSKVCNIMRRFMIQIFSHH